MRQLPSRFHHPDMLQCKQGICLSIPQGLVCKYSTMLDERRVRGASLAGHIVMHACAWCILPLP